MAVRSRMVYLKSLFLNNVGNKLKGRPCPTSRGRNRRNIRCSVYCRLFKKSDNSDLDFTTLHYSSLFEALLITDVIPLYHHDVSFPCVPATSPFAHRPDMTPPSEHEMVRNE